MYTVTDIPPGFTRHFTLTVNGQVIQDVSRLVLESRWGRIDYGLRDNGDPHTGRVDIFDGWTFTQKDTGVLMPFCIRKRQLIRKELLVGVVREHRLNLGGYQLCALGGFANKGEKPKDAAKREGEEEAGIKGELFQIGNPMVNDRFAWNASEEGIGHDVPFGQKVPFSDLVPDGPNQWLPRQGLIKVKGEGQLIFLPANDAVEMSQDIIVHSLVAKLRRLFDMGQL